MKKKDINHLAQQMKDMMTETAQVDQLMKQLQNDLHKIISERLFKIFPFLPDAMEPDEIKWLGERISRHLYSLSEELKNFSFTVQQRITPAS
jgi:hypothetical protein